jgi:hypothetical protein
LVLCAHACSFNGFTEAPPTSIAADAEPSVDGGRVTDDVIALYRFKDSTGGEIADVSGFGMALDLAVVGSGNYEVTSEGLNLIGDTLISSKMPASKLAEACALTNELSIELWIRSASVAQTGPARIVGMSMNSTNANFVIGQGSFNGDAESRFNPRIRTATAGANGTKAVTDLEVVTTEWMHVVLTRAADDTTAFYIDGEAIGLFASGEPVGFPGALNNWNPGFTLNLGDELASTGVSRTWHGEYGLLAIYRRALSAAEVSQNFLAGR